MSEQVTVIAKVRAKEGMAEEVLKELTALLEPSRADAGCINYNLHRSADDESEFMFYENWQSRQALDDHIMTPHLRAFLERSDSLLDGPLDVTMWELLS